MKICARPIKKTVELVREHLKDPDSVVFFFDEGRFGLQPQVGRLWAKRGSRPRTFLKIGYKNFYLFAAVDPFRGENYLLQLPWVNTDTMNEFLRYMGEAYAENKILLIMDRAGYHRAKNLKAPSNISIEYLPPYSPDLNPVEKLWSWLRRHITKNRLFQSLDHLEEELFCEINSLTNSLLSTLCRCSYLMQVK
jgi:transposase